MSTPIAATLITAALAVTMIAAESRRRPGEPLLSKRILKPMASAGFIVVALMVGAPESDFGRLVLLALALCAVGDVLLIPRKTGKRFKAGMMFFLAGHLGYCAAFLNKGVDVIGLVAGATIMAAGVFIFFRTGWSHLDAKMRAPMTAYIVAISLMVSSAGGAAWHTGNIWFIVGALLFAASDILIARDRFVKSRFWSRAVILLLYYSAQLIFAHASGQIVQT